MKLYDTKLEKIKYARYAAGMWSFFDVSKGRKSVQVGRWYPTRETLLLSMDNYLKRNWGLV